MSHTATMEYPGAHTFPVVLPDNFADHVQSAVNSYQHTLPSGEVIWPPFVLNAAPCLPDFEPLARSGAGKATPEKFAAAANYVYNLIGGRSHVDAPVSEVIRQRLADGSLPHDAHNYTGVDCSGLTTTVLERSLGACGIDLYSHLIMPPEDVEKALRRRGTEQNDDLLARSLSEEGLSVRAFVRAVYGHNSPVRAVNVERLAWNSSAVREDDIRPGDIGLYRPFDMDRFTHVAVVLGAIGGSYVEFVDSNREDPKIDLGGIGMFDLPIENVATRNNEEQRGNPSIRRLNFLQAA